MVRKKLQNLSTFSQNKHFLSRKLKGLQILGRKLDLAHDSVML